MRDSLKKLALPALVSLCLGGSVLLSAQTYEMFTGGHAEVVGDMLTTETNAPDSSIRAVQLNGQGGGNRAYPGCGQSKCDYNVADLPAGAYTVTVRTSGGSFTDAVVVE